VLFRLLAGAAGRSPETIPITIFALGRPNRKRLDTYAELGVSRVVVPPPTMMRHDSDATHRWLDQWSPVIDEMR
jgi:hypothetical protein